MAAVAEKLSEPVRTRFVCGGESVDRWHIKTMAYVLYMCRYADDHGCCYGLARKIH